ncbi:uncharacterized protein LOC107040462 isoform X2 [Diachasma alloeum]|uniref:uncharacterized protein LOC107040462 isoform X2 n=1 Tax=Diachasma alloeum TaxID=454923 RepID=UPI0007381509|nr:uncharacterized protein LOC107040462 isoform X2 [Diachasma alloeum]
MCWKYVFIILLFVCTVESGYEDDNCIYKYICDDEPTKYERDIQGRKIQCNIDDIPKNELILISEGNSSTLKTILNLPNVECAYDVALVVNSTVKSQEECEHHEFNDDSSSYQEVYTDYRICVVDEQSRRENGSNEEPTCKEDKIVLSHEHIFTGCYALRFSIDDEYKYVYQGRKYIVSNYELTKVQEPTHQCTYFNREDVNNSDGVMFSLDISLHSASPTLHLGLRTFPTDHESENNACTNYGRDYHGDEWAINMNSSASRTSFTRNCSFMTVHENLTFHTSYAESIDCRFSLGVPSNMSYCFKLRVIDERCSKGSLWNIPRRSYPCTWMLECNRDPKIRGTSEHLGEVDGPRKIISESSLFLPVGIALVLFVFAISGILMAVHRWRSTSRQAYLNANMRDLRVASNTEADVVDTDDELRKCGKTGDIDETKGIVLLYARGSTSFMAFMTEFKDVLKLYCRCHVYDWYAPCEWNEVAKVGACDWATNLFKNHHRAVWIDTPGARSLASNRFGDDKCGAEAISDFRDMAFFAVLDYAKRSVLNTKLQYSRHFIARLEGFDNGTSTEDPFSDLSPHARYLIPYHLSQLCSHLSLRKSDSSGQALMTEEAQMRERLKQFKNESKYM